MDMVKNEMAKLVARDGNVCDYLGSSVAISSNGRTIVAGADGDTNEKGNGAGSVYIFTRKASLRPMSELAKLVARDGSDNDNFGSSVAISSDGGTVAVAARNGGKGTVYIFSQDEGVWTEKAKLVASDGTALSYFGRSIAVSSDGGTVIVGAFLDTNEKGNGAGSVYIFSQDEGVWTEKAKLLASDGRTYDQFGSSVAISSDGGTVAVGANDADGGKGSVYIFSQDEGVWVEKAKLVASDGTARSYFGTSVAVSSDGKTVAVGAYRQDASGSVYIFSQDEGVWTEQAKLVASDGRTDDYFGSSVAISGNGKIIVAGAHQNSEKGNGAGSAYIFTHNGDRWAGQVKLLAGGGGTGDNFGSSVAISSNGRTIVAGARNSDRGTGAVLLFDTSN